MRWWVAEVRMSPRGCRATIPLLDSMCRPRGRRVHEHQARRTLASVYPPANLNAASDHG